MTINRTEERPLPSGWEWTQMGDVTFVQSGAGFPKIYQGNSEGDLPFAKVSDISNAVKYDDAILNKASNYVTNEVAHELRAKVIPVGSTIFAKIGEAVRLNRRAFVGVPCVVDNNVMGLLPEDSILLPRYLFYFMQTIDLYDLSRATTVPSVRKSDIETIKFPLAPFEEQERIVAEIEKQFTRLDQAVASLKRLQSNLARYKASVLKAACEGRLVPQDPNDEPAADLLARILAERRDQWEKQEWQSLIAKAQKKAAQAQRKTQGLPARIKDLQPDEWEAIAEADYARYLPKHDKWKEKYKEPAGVETAVLPDLPEGWVWARVDQLGEVRLGRQRSPKNHHGPHMRPYLRAANATWDGVDLSDVMGMNFKPSELEIYRLKKGDILLSEASGSANEVGKPFIWKEQIPDCCFQNTLIRVRLFHLPPDYLHLHFFADAQTGRFGRIAKGVGIHHLGANRLAEMPVAVPPLAEQERIVAEVERRLSVVTATEQAITTNLARAERLRQSILSRAFSGQLVPQNVL